MSSMKKVPRLPKRKPRKSDFVGPPKTLDFVGRAVAHLTGAQYKKWSEADNDRLVQVKFALTMFLDQSTGMKSRRDVIAALIDKYDIEERTAYNRWSEMNRIYGDVLETDKKVAQAAAIERGKELYNKAITDNDEYMKYLAMQYLAKVEGPYTDSGTDYSKLEPHNVVIKIDKALSDSLEALVDQGSVNLAKAVAKDPTIEDVEFTEE